MQIFRFELAASKDYRPALNGLGRIHLQGNELANVTANVTKAYEWFKRASDMGSLDGHHNLAIVFLTGGFNTSVFLENELKAEEAARAAKGRGNSDDPWEYYNAKYSHVVRARPFRPLPPNIPLAIKYFTLAAKAGHHQSLETLGHFYTSPVSLLAIYHAKYLLRKKNSTGGDGGRNSSSNDGEEEDFDRIEFGVNLRDSGYVRAYNMSVPLK